MNFLVFCEICPCLDRTNYVKICPVSRQIQKNPGQICPRQRCPDKSGTLYYWWCERTIRIRLSHDSLLWVDRTNICRPQTDRPPIRKATPSYAPLPLERQISNFTLRVNYLAKISRIELNSTARTLILTLPPWPTNPNSYPDPTPYSIPIKNSALQ